MEDNSNKKSNSPYNVFLDNYNQGNKFLNDMTGSFLEQIIADEQTITTKDQGFLKDSFLRVDELRKEKDKSNYQKTFIIGNILSSISNDIIESQNPLVKRSGINIINSFLNLAKETEDQQLLDVALKISERIKV